MKKMLRDCIDTDQFYAVRRKDFPHYWMKVLGGYHNGAIGEVCNVLEADHFSTLDERNAAERFARENDGEVVLVAVQYIKRFYYPSKLKSKSMMSEQ